MIFEQPVRFEHVFTFNVLDGGSDIIDMVYMLSREGISKQAIDEYHEQRQILNRYVVSALMMSDPILKCIRRELRKMAPKMKVDTGQIEDLLKSEILKRDVVEGEEMTTARRKVRRASKRAKGKRSASSTPSHKTSANTEQGDNDAP
jgi:hypothetical protein